MEVKISGNFPVINIEAHGADPLEISSALASALCTFAGKFIRSSDPKSCEAAAIAFVGVASRMDKTEIDLSDILKGGDRR